tara:strand:- start:963 stop:1358 length:396 start_codon:yes stop_codon:yes gene_type:complete
MKIIQDLLSFIKKITKICDPLIIYIILGIFKFFILILVYKELTKEGFAPVNESYKLNSNTKNSKCDGDDPNCPHCNQVKKLDLIMAMNIMFYMYVIFGIFLYLLCKNNMNNAAWFIILYPFLSRLVWMLII